jgi:hypothetical protein
MYANFFIWSTNKLWSKKILVQILLIPAPPNGTSQTSNKSHFESFINIYFSKEMLYLSKVAVFNLISFDFSMTMQPAIKFHTLLNKLECFYPNELMQPSMLAAQIILGQKKSCRESSNPRPRNSTSITSNKYHFELL